MLMDSEEAVRLVVVGLRNKAPAETIVGIVGDIVASAQKALDERLAELRGAETKIAALEEALRGLLIQCWGDPPDGNPITIEAMRGYALTPVEKAAIAILPLDAAIDAQTSDAAAPPAEREA